MPENDPRQNFIPIPDPTKLTSELIEKETIRLKELFDSKIEAVRSTVMARMDEQDRARATLRRDIEAAFTHTDEMVSGLRHLHETRFDEREKRFHESDKASHAAIDAAFAAAKEAVAQQNNTTNLMMLKNENMFSKQIDSLGSEIRTTTGALSDKIEEAKKQMAVYGQQIMVMQGQGAGEHAEWSKGRSNTGVIISVVGGGVAFLAFLVMLFNVMTGKL
jgi:hypothetical protein